MWSISDAVGTRSLGESSKIESNYIIEKILKEALTRAAIKNNFQIVQLIMMRGVSLSIPHDYFCLCDVCVSDKEGDYMMFINRRLDRFRALAGPAYIAITEEDPMMACFQLSQIFKRLELIESENQVCVNCIKAIIKVNYMYIYILVNCIKAIIKVHYMYISLWIASRRLLK